MLNLLGTAMSLETGTRAPDFEGQIEDGSKIRLYDVLQEGPVVLYFYPKDETPGCTKEACTFRDNWDDIRNLGATILGVSSDSVDSHKSFKEHRKLQFSLVSDSGGSIRKLYDAKGFLLPDRVTYVIDRDGTILHVFKSQVSPAQHSQEALEALKKINERQKPADRQA